MADSQGMSRSLQGLPQHGKAPAQEALPISEPAKCPERVEMECGKTTSFLQLSLALFHSRSAEPLALKE